MCRGRYFCIGPYTDIVRDTANYLRLGVFFGAFFLCALTKTCLVPPFFLSVRVCLFTCVAIHDLHRS